MHFFTYMVNRFFSFAKYLCQRDIRNFEEIYPPEIKGLSRSGAVIPRRNRLNLTRYTAKNILRNFAFAIKVFKNQFLYSKKFVCKIWCQSIISLLFLVFYRNIKFHTSYRQNNYPLKKTIIKN